MQNFFLKRGYEVNGIIRRSSSFNTKRIENIYKDPHITDSKFHLYYGDVTDALSNEKEKLGWQPKITFKNLVKIMMKNELK